MEAERMKIVGLRGKALAKKVLAEFWIEDGKLKMVWHDASTKLDIELSGIYSPETGTVRPKDGAKFLEALPKAYGQSSRIWVE